MTLQQLSDRWNELAVAGLGRGSGAPVDGALAMRVRTQYEAFRAWLVSQGPLDELRERVLASDDGARWVRSYNELRELVAAQGRAVPDELAVPRGLAGEAFDLAKSVVFVAAFGAAAALVARMRKGR